MSIFSKDDWSAIQAIRGLSVDAVQKANSGHPGLPLGAAPMAYVLWSRHLKVSPANPQWVNRDRFVFSPGHGSMLLYSLLHCFGFALPLSEIENFRKWSSLTPGHPEFRHTPGVEATTGPLGQGAANAVGMAIAERNLAYRFNRSNCELVDHTTYALVSDGDLMEGLSAEAASLAGHLKLGKLIYLYDSNDITLDGPASLSFSEDVAQRYASYGWHVQTVKNGDIDLDGIDAALHAAKAEGGRPSLIIVKTTIGYGSPNKAGSSKVHGSPLGPEELKLTKIALGLDPEKAFDVSETARSTFEARIRAQESEYKAWKTKETAFRAASPELAIELDRAIAGRLPTAWKRNDDLFAPDTQLATRESSGKVIQAIASQLPELLGGDADLSCSTNTSIIDGGSFNSETGRGRNIHYGVREHAMAAIANGLAYHGGIRPFVSTFFCFADYLRPALRLSAMNHLAVTYVFTHDSIGLGEDGPTHQPIEQLASLRAMPGLVTLRPADAFETSVAWSIATENTKGPSALVLTRQKVPAVPKNLGSVGSPYQGGWIVAKESTSDPKVVLVATGSEVSLALDVRKQLESQSIATRVVSLLSWEIFRAQSAEYRTNIMSGDRALRVSIEAASSFGWHEWVGREGLTISIDHFGASAPANELFKQFGFDPNAIVEKIRTKLVNFS